MGEVINFVDGNKAGCRNANHAIFFKKETRKKSGNGPSRRGILHASVITEDLDEGIEVSIPFKIYRRELTGPAFFGYVTLGEDGYLWRHKAEYINERNWSSGLARAGGYSDVAEYLVQMVQDRAVPIFARLTTIDCVRTISLYPYTRGGDAVYEIVIIHSDPSEKAESGLFV